MTDQELRKLSRKDLLELLISQSRERDTLQAELEEVKAELRSRRICIEHAGSIAEASLQLNGVFEAAQAAAQQYLENICQRSEYGEEAFTECERACARRKEDIRQRFDSQLQEADRIAGELENWLRCRSEETETGEKEIDRACYTELLEYLKNFYRVYENLKAMLDAGGKA